MAKRDFDNSYPSVTTILGVLRKIGLEMWFKHNTAKFCDEKSNKGKLIGTQIHEAIQSYIETGKAKSETEYAEEVGNALKSFMAFRKDYQEIILQRAEMALTSENYKFNGIVDCLAGDKILDWKTGECKNKEFPVIYDEYKYQVSAYVHLYNEVNNATIQEAIIVVVAKDKVAYDTCRLNKDEIDFYFNEVFLSCLKILTAQKRKDFTCAEIK